MVYQHYNKTGLLQKILNALVQAGKNTEALTRDDLISFDEFHVKGRKATRQLATLAELSEQSGLHILDIGCGLGGAARTLAAEFGCKVTGIDLTESYCQAGQMLTQSIGMDEQVQILNASGIELPFKTGTFDGVWMQHVSMNIADKPRLFAEINRVLRPDGFLALHEACAGDNAPLYFPVPWARDGAISFLVTPEELHTIIQNTGLQKQAWRDDTADCANWFSQRADKPLPSILNLGLIAGEDFPIQTQNLLRNLNENRIRVMMGVWRKN